MNLFLLCLKIILVRITDVSMGTVYTIMVVKRKKWLAGIIGFIEIFIWFMIVREALTFETSSFFENLMIGISYALGFAIGTVIGGHISDKYIHGIVSVQIITSKYDLLTSALRDKGYAVSSINIEGLDKDTNKKMLLLEINDTKLNDIKNIAREIDSKSFLTVSETKYITNGFIK